MFFKEGDSINDLILNDDTTIKITSEYYLRNYMQFMKQDIANGNPSSDTVSSYRSSIDNFIDWCLWYKMPNVLMLQEQHVKAYRDYLVRKEFRPATISLKLTAIRQFYATAKRWKLIEENPVLHVHSVKDPDSDLPNMRYLTAGQFEYLIYLINVKDENGDFIENNYRDRLMIMFMGIEGLRVIEIKRLNIEDINWENNTILVHGKGHNDFIYPREDIMRILRTYLDLKNKNVVGDKYGTPVFTAISNRNYAQRIDRHGIRKSVNQWFQKAGIRVDSDSPNLSCHLLRHTCGTLLYKETKDLQVVKETLRHKDLKMSSKYAHLQNRLLNRYTNAIPIKPPEDF